MASREPYEPRRRRRGGLLAGILTFSLGVVVGIVAVIALVVIAIVALLL